MNECYTCGQRLSGRRAKSLAEAFRRIQDALHESLGDHGSELLRQGPHGEFIHYRGSEEEFVTVDSDLVPALCGACIVELIDKACKEKP